MWILDELSLRFFDIAVALSLEHHVLSHTLNKPAHFIMQWIVYIWTPYFTLKACVNFKSYSVMLQPRLLLSLMPCILWLLSIQPHVFRHGFLRLLYSLWTTKCAKSIASKKKTLILLPVFKRVTTERERQLCRTACPLYVQKHTFLCLDEVSLTHYLQQGAALNNIHICALSAQACHNRV